MSASHRTLKVSINILVVFSMLFYVLPFGSTYPVKADPQDDALPSDSWGIALGDLDGDGDLDAFVANQDGYYGEHRPGPQGFNEVWLNDGNANFTNSGQALGQEATEAVDLADLDGDGDLDAFTANTDGALIWINGGSANFTQGPWLGNANAWAVDLGDLDGDGDVDAFVGVMGGQDQVWINQGSMNFVLSQEVGLADQTRHVALSDLDGDLDLDVFAVNHFYDNNVVYLNDGSGNFNLSQTIPNQDAVDLSLGDLDGDGDVDAFVGNSQGEADDLYLNDGTGNFSLYDQIGNYSTEATALGDVDGDGDLDIYIGDGFGGPNRIWLNDGAGGFTNSGQALGFSYTFGTALGDLDSDGDLDILDANMAAEIVWLNDGNGLFTFSAQYLGQPPAPDYYPTVLARANQDRIEGNNWISGSTLTIEIDNPSTGQNPDKTVTAMVGTAPWNPNLPWFEVNLNDYDLKPGDMVTVTDGTKTKQLAIQNLTITDYDLDTELVYGTAQPGQLLYVQACDESNCANRNETADQNGNWTANFAVPGDENWEQQTVDVQAGTWIDSNINDEDGDMTRFGMGVPSPNIIARLTLNQVDANGWPDATSLTLTVEHPETELSPDYTDTATSQPGDPQDPNSGTSVSFEFGDEYILESGDIVTVTGGGFSRITTVADIHITNVDVENDIVSGIAGAGITSVNVRLWSSPMEMQRDAVVVDGAWSADFSLPSPEFEVYDIKPGDSGVVRWFEGDGDFTTDYWEVPNPTLETRPNEENVAGQEWPLGASVQVTIDDPETQNNPDFSGTTVVGLADWNPNQTWFSIQLDGYDLKPGDLVTVSDGSTTKQHTVINLSIDGYDLDADTVVGSAGPNQFLSVWTCWQGNPCINRDETADQNGNWTTSFAVPGDEDWEYETADLRAGSWIDSGIWDEDGDATLFGVSVPNPAFGVRANDDRVEGWQWLLGATVNVEIDDPSTQANPDYSGSATVFVADWNPNETWFNIDFAGTYDIKVGDIVTVTDGATVKQHTVVDLNFTQIDIATERVFGTADPDQLVNIWTCWESDPCINRDETADQNGDWMTDFSVPGEKSWEQDTADLRVGSWIDSSVNDEDGDSTMYGVTVEAPQCQPGDTISGTVHEHDGVTPLPNAVIQIEDFNTGEVLFTTLTDQNGQFGCSLPDGDYRLLAFADNYSREYFDQATDANAALLQVAGGAQFANVDFTLSRLATMEHLTFNLENPLLQELSVRQAIFLGTNRQEILNEAFLPYGIFGVVSNSIVPPEHWAAAPASELTLYPYDPTQAEAILEAAGWINRDGDIYRENAAGDELAFTFKTTQAPLRVAASELFRQYMEQIGIRITVENIPAGVFFGDNGTVATRDFDIAEFAWGGGYDDETFLEPYRTGDASNHTGYSNPAFDAAMANAAAASSEAEKLTYYFEAQSILSQDLPIIPYFTRYDVAPVMTDPGPNVTVSPETYLDITFDEVTDGGVTTVLPLDIDPADLPPNFQLLGQVYDIGTSASFTSAQVCFSYDDAGLTLAQEQSIQLLHLENGSWVNVTDSGYPDTVNNVVCGTVDSFSPFAIVYSSDSTPPTITWVGDIEDGDFFYYSFVPPAPTCTADDASGVDGGCVVTGYATFVGSHTLIATASDNAGNTTIDTRTYTVLPWTVTGFYQPVDMNGAYNLVKNGGTVPLKFEVFAGSTELTDPALIQSLTYAQTSCDSTAITDEIEATVTGGTSLRYDAATGQFIYNWKTPRVAGNCYRLTLKTFDGSTLVAYFKLK